MDTNAAPSAARAATPTKPVGLRDGRALADHCRMVRRMTEHLCEPLAVDDYMLQSMPDASPIKWHLAHTTWFFETFVLSRYLRGYRPFHPQFGFLFNSYYEAVGPRWPRAERGLLSRPTIAEVYRYRAYVDDHLARVLSGLPAGIASKPMHLAEQAATILLGINHEQQHQELMITDLKHGWSMNPLHPVYRDAVSDAGETKPLNWVEFDEGLLSIGADGEGFAFDNEAPRHRVFVNRFAIASRLVTVADYLEFMADGGYHRADLWLSDGWAMRCAGDWTTPLYWRQEEGAWSVVTLAGVRPLNPAEPLCHVSYYEADAFARWAGARLPTEAEWEIAAAGTPITGHFLEGGRFHPAAAVAEDDGGQLRQLYGEVWQWTASPYISYPGYRPPTGALGEYNGKFMSNQMVLRGASCATPRSHARRTYRNFFPPGVRWQFSGLRLARDCE